MNNDHFHPPSSTIQGIDLNTMTVGEFGKEAEARGMRAPSLLAEYERRPAASGQPE